MNSDLRALYDKANYISKRCKEQVSINGLWLAAFTIDEINDLLEEVFLELPATDQEDYIRTFLQEEK